MLLECCAIKVEILYQTSSFLLYIKKKTKNTYIKFGYLKKGLHVRKFYKIYGDFLLILQPTEIVDN